MYRRLGARAPVDLIAAQIAALEQRLGEEKKHEESL
jgi:hypothetical protein